MRLAAFAALVLANCAPSAEPDAGPVLLTVFDAGAGAEQSGGALFDRYGLSGPATGFTGAGLATLGEFEIETGYPLGADPARWRGPRLSAVLDAAGAGGAAARLTAIDGYQVTISADEIDAFEPVLATRRGGEPLSLGGLGPAILVWPRGDDPALAEMNDDRWVWGVIAVEALEPDDG